MFKRYAAVPSLSLLFLLTGCQQAPPDTHDADVKTIKDLEAKWDEAFNTRDIGKTVAYYADDATVLIPNAPAFTGTDAIKAGLKPMLDDAAFKLSFAATKVDVAKSGDLAYTQGPYTMTTTNPATKKPAEDRGKYLTVFKKQADGTWKAVEDTFMTDLPAAAPAPAKTSTKTTKKKK
jgi:uncharacterized protein (TIGR02246 family)